VFGDEQPPSYLQMIKSAGRSSNVRRSADERSKLGRSQRQIVSPRKAAAGADWEFKLTSEQYKVGFYIQHAVGGGDPTNG
jgi:hypothetical protein